MSHTPKATYLNQYLQVRRWAWGAVDVPYAIQEVMRRTDIPLRKRFLAPLGIQTYGFLPMDLPPDFDVVRGRVP